MEQKLFTYKMYKLNKN